MYVRDVLFRKLNTFFGSFSSVRPAVDGVGSVILSDVSESERETEGFSGSWVFSSE